MIYKRAPRVCIPINRLLQQRERLDNAHDVVGTDTLPSPTSDTSTSRARPGTASDAFISWLPNKRSLCKVRNSFAPAACRSFEPSGPALRDTREGGKKDLERKKIIFYYASKLSELQRHQSLRRIATYELAKKLWPL